MRSTFLREFGVDPIDLVPKGCSSHTNLNPFFFLDDDLKGEGRDYNSARAEEEQIIAPFTDQWNKFRLSKMEEGSKRLFASILDKIKVPVWSDLVLNTPNRAISETIPQTKFVSSEGYVLDPGNAGVPFGVMVRDPASVRIVIDPVPSLHTDVIVRSYSQILKPGQKFPFTFCYDLSRLKPDEVMKFLDKWFDPQKP